MKKIVFTIFTFFSIMLISFSQNLNVTLASRLSYGSQRLSNICGWVDPADSKEYALVGAQNGLSIVDITNPANPVEIIQVPGPSSTWREIKTVGNYAYITTEQCCIGLQIVELTNLPNTNLAVTTWTPKIGNDTLKKIHALHADNGKIYLYGSNVGNKGAIIADVTANPMAPVYLGSYDPRYVHDGYVRNDTIYAGHIYDGECAIVNASNPASPVVLATFETPTKFTHNTWLSANSKICFTTDENANSYLGAFDISDLANIYETDRIQTSPGSNSIVHNTHIIQNNNIDYAVSSWYTEGITIVDASRPANLVQVGNYDTYTPSVTGFRGCWGVYPFFPSGTIVASDMDSGLFVFAPTYVRACYLEGVVKNCLTGNPISGVNVALQVANPQSNSHTDVTDFLGQYAVGIARPDTYIVVLSKTGYLSDTDTVVLSAGVVKLNTFLLCPKQTFSYGGNIFDNSSLVGISNAKISIYDTGSRWDTVTDASGNFSIPNMYAGTYFVAAGKWGYVTNCPSGQSITSSSGTLSMGLDKGIYDDFLWDFGWTVSGNATGGIWERGEPQGTFFQGNPINPDADVINDCGNQAYVTGNKGVTSSDDDVDGGTTILTSPVFDLTGYIQPVVYFSRWKKLSTNSSDTVVISISNGSSTAMLESLSTLSLGSSSWLPRNYKISDYLPPTSTMTFRMEVSDNDQDNTNEGGLDHFLILDSINISVNELANKVDVRVYPNPFSEKTVIQVVNHKLRSYSFVLFDVFGREVCKLNQGNIANDFILHREGLSSGIYFYKIFESGSTVSAGKICVE
ncbi:MAG: choice-of-anchor B family protein [Bacteroidetes bacterium]|nr:MAG: choice-of-anchor B family protein [Bacteroidota bacterium]